MTELRAFDIETVHVATAGGHNGGLPDVLHLSSDCGHLERAAAAASAEDSSNTTNSWAGDRIREVATETRHPSEDICEWCEYRHTDTQLPPHTEREPYHDAEWLVELYHEANHTAAEIAELCDCSEWTICKWIHKHDIKVRYQSEHWLRARYHEDKMTIREIASECEARKTTIWEYLCDHDIETRPPGGKQQLPGAEWLREQYQHNGLSTYDIADICGCSPEPVRDRLHEYDIAFRKYQDEAWLRKQYHEHGLTRHEIAEACGCYRTTIARWLEKYDIRTRPQGGAD